MHKGMKREIPCRHIVEERNEQAPSIKLFGLKQPNKIDQVDQPNLNKTKHYIFFPRQQSIPKFHY